MRGDCQRCGIEGEVYRLNSESSRYSVLCLDCFKIQLFFCAGVDYAKEEIDFDPVKTTNVGIKYDSEKNRLELLPFESLEEVAKVLSYGAKKYEDNNWAKGMAWSRLLGAAMRHLFAWARGVDKDEESGLPHLAHAACCVLFLLSYGLNGNGTDDRRKV